MEFNGESILFGLLVLVHHKPSQAAVPSDNGNIAMILRTPRVHVNSIITVDSSYFLEFPQKLQRNNGGTDIEVGEETVKIQEEETRAFEADIGSINSTIDFY
ncbi:hypothetical protein WN944_013104 [Citrus x changshan-huyou]|uniref:Uncharacterized protein n=1 Tax=Citrus x changshan-huyou TaxID=2935761 RepID=A0AAP0M7B4_9ROSI